MNRLPRMSAFVCWLAVALEGYDLVSFGAAIPNLLKSQYLGSSPLSTTWIAVLSLIGTGIGAAGVGFFADRWGRRLVLLISVALFSAFTIVMPLVPNLELMALTRFISGIGMGACMPIALALASESASVAKTGRSTTLVMTGYHAGAVLTSLLALVFVEKWQWLFYIGGAIGLLSIPLMWIGLPESRAFLDVKAGIAPRVPISAIVRRPYRLISACLWIGSFMGLLLVYGMNTWLPTIMSSAGYSLSGSLLMLLVLNAGGIFGLLLAGWVADKRGIKPSTLFWYIAATISIVLLSVRFNSEWLLNIVIFISGVFVFSAQVLIYALVTKVFPVSVRATALGMTSAVGRLGAITGPAITGTLVAIGIAYPGGFYVFAAVSVLAFLAIWIAPIKVRLETGDSAAINSEAAAR